MKHSIKLISAALLFLFLSACKNEAKDKKQSQQANEQQVKKDDHIAPVDHVLTKEDQARLTPDGIIQSLTEGNERFMRNDLTKRDHSAQVRKSTYAQYPKAVILSCIDSRVPVEDVFDKGIGDLFVTRVAGNISNPDVLGSLEYSCKVAGSKLVLVMGHEHCGAVKSAVKDVKLGNITELLSKIRPAVTEVESTFEGADKTYKNKEFVHEVCIRNVRNTKREIREKSSILKEMEDKGEIKIVGAIYDLDDGKVTFLN